MCLKSTRFCVFEKKKKVRVHTYVLLSRKQSSMLSTNDYVVKVPICLEAIIVSRLSKTAVIKEAAVHQARSHISSERENSLHRIEEYKSCAASNKLLKKKKKTQKKNP